MDVAPLEARLDPMLYAFNASSDAVARLGAGTLNLWIETITRRSDRGAGRGGADRGEARRSSRRPCA